MTALSGIKNVGLLNKFLSLKSLYEPCPAATFKNERYSARYEESNNFIKYSEIQNQDFFLQIFTFNYNPKVDVTIAFSPRGRKIFYRLQL